MKESILQYFGFSGGTAVVIPIQQGLINHTWKVTAGNEHFILQRVNEKVFQHPFDIAHNTSFIGEHLAVHHPDYYFVNALPPKNSPVMLHDKEEGYFRLLPFVRGSHAKTVAATPEQAYEAALQFGRFTAVCKGLDCSKLKITIPSFHNLSLYHKKYRDAVVNGEPSRIKEASDLTKQLNEWSFIVDEYEKICEDPEFRQRVTHHDTKISNVLFNEDDKGICVIDLDTVMPGYFISDAGDMLRTCLSPVSEEETDLQQVEVRNDYYTAIRDGYMKEMHPHLSKIEEEHFFFSGLFMTYMQAIRFLTDHLSNDVYYGAAYPGHNFNRAKNQAVLLQLMIENEKELVKR